MSRSLRHQHGIALDLGNLAAVYTEMGRLEDAYEMLVEALQIARELGDRHGEGMNLSNIGHVCAELKSFQDAGPVLRDGAGRSATSAERPAASCR